MRVDFFKDHSEYSSIVGKHFLFVTFQFYPNGDANSIVVFNIAKELVKRGAVVTVVYITDERTKKTEYEGITLKPIYVPMLREKKRLFHEIKAHPFSALYMVTSKIICQIFNFLPRYKTLSAEYIYIKKYKKKLKYESENRIYDYCIVSLNPIEAIMAVMQVKEISRGFAIYQVDTYWNNATKDIRYRNERLLYEKKFNHECLFNLTTEQVIETTARYLEEDSNKLFKSEFPMIIKPTKNECSNEDGIIKCVYTGTLYKDIRPPKNIIRVIAKIREDNIRFDFYGANQELIKKDPLYQEVRSKLQLFGTVGVQDAAHARQTAKFLINIDNVCIEQVPSKIFEYISTGKPIINFYFNKDSALLKYLNRYPLCANIYIGDNFDLDGACSDLTKFIKQSTKMNVPFADIEREFKKNTPTYVVDQILELYGIQ